MELKDLLAQQWASCLDQEDWFPPLRTVLDSITAEQALWKPADGPANSIWETARHLLFYKKRLLYRFRGWAEEPSAADNDGTFIIPDSSAHGWEQDRQELYAVHQSLSDILQNANMDTLLAPIPGEQSLAMEIKSLAMHDAYHIGQIVLLSKLEGVWPSHRRFE